MYSRNRCEARNVGEEEGQGGGVHVGANRLIVSFTGCVAKHDGDKSFYTEPMNPLNPQLYTRW